MVPKWTSKYVAHRDHIRDLRSDQQGDICCFWGYKHCKTGLVICTLINHGIIGRLWIFTFFGVVCRLHVVVGIVSCGWDNCVLASEVKGACNLTFPTTAADTSNGVGGIVSIVHCCATFTFEHPYLFKSSLATKAHIFSTFANLTWIFVNISVFGIILNLWSYVKVFAGTFSRHIAQGNTQGIAWQMWVEMEDGP